MSSEALGVSVAPSVLHSCCIQEGKQQALDDVTRFKAQICVATSIMRFLIDNFGVTNLFSRANYEYYARVSGRVLFVHENWIFAFRYPVSFNHSLLSHFIRLIQFFSLLAFRSGFTKYFSWSRRRMASIRSH